MPKGIQFYSGETPYDGVEFKKIDCTVVIAVDRLTDGSMAHNVYTRLGDLVYRDTSCATLDEAVEKYTKLRVALGQLQESLREPATDGPVAACEQKGPWPGWLLNAKS
jgi:hypothetical protein